MSAWPWSVHCTIAPRREDTLSRVPGVKPLIYSNRSDTLRRVHKHTHTNTGQTITNQQLQSTPTDIQLLVKNMSECGGENKGERDTCGLCTPLGNSLVQVIQARAHSTLTNYGISLCYKLWECHLNMGREKSIEYLLHPVASLES